VSCGEGNVVPWGCDCDRAMAEPSTGAHGAVTLPSTCGCGGALIGPCESCDCDGAITEPGDPSGFDSGVAGAFDAWDGTVDWVGDLGCGELAACDVSDGCVTCGCDEL
jgi:hypothetical protein